MVYSGGGDIDLFVDDDGSGYVIYDAWSNDHRVTIEQLAPDFYGYLVKMKK